MTNKPRPDHPFGTGDDIAVDVLVIGSGPTGLGAASRLAQRAECTWALIDSTPGPGGLACTDTTDEGFLFDMGGHVVFSHYKYFDQLIDAAVGEGEKNWSTHERVSYVWMKNRWVPYPLQNNLYCLPADDQVKCISGAIDAMMTSARSNTKPRDFDEWIMKVMGQGIADLFMRPYNFKVWAYPTTEMQCEWLGERVATVDVKKVVANVIKNKPDAGWGPNSVFKFPTQGGTGGIWTGVANLLPQEKMHYNKSLVGFDFDAKIAKFSDGSKIRFKSAISTAALDITLTWLGRKDLADRLKYSSTHVVGIGLRGANPHDKKCWMYYPEDDCPFYRCTVFSHYAESNCPSGKVKLPTLRLGDPALHVKNATPQEGPYWSLMFEISESPVKPVDLAKVVEETIQGAINTKMIDADAEIVSVYHRRLERGYPTPSLERDEVLKVALPLLKEKGIWSRGRFGAWKYEVGNQDHSCMQGVEAVDNILHGSTELTLNYCDMTNGRRNEDLTYTKRK